MTTRYHIVGIGGAGMSAIAHLLLDQGTKVSGCDMQENALTDVLRSRGAQVVRGHSAAHCADADILLISSAVRPDHVEVGEATRRGMPVLKRADLWREWSQSKPTLAVAGTHGKTTTTAMAALILQELGHDPAYIVPAGGPVPGLPRFARWGTGPFVIEADEYDRLFLGLYPEVAIITSVDWDHVDVYPTPSDVETAFIQFAAQARRALIICDEDSGARRLLNVERSTQNRERVDDANSQTLVQSYGFDPSADWYIGKIELEQEWTHFSLRVPQGTMGEGGRPARGRLRVPGRHNVLNAAAAVAALAHFGVPPQKALDALAGFQGAARRFEWKGEADGITFIDDYAHNPAKVAATLAAARERFDKRRLVVYFQPHTFSRTAALLQQLADAFADADVVLIGDIYPSRERQEDFPGLNAAALAERIPGGKAAAAGDLTNAAAQLCETARPGDVVLTLGAGDGYKVGDQVRERLQAGEVQRAS
jgi:UDP-N-acetylmuramate--alanine ligase